ITRLQTFNSIDECGNRGVIRRVSGFHSLHIRSVACSVGRKCAWHPSPAFLRKLGRISQKRIDEPICRQTAGQIDKRGVEALFGRKRAFQVGLNGIVTLSVKKDSAAETHARCDQMVSKTFGIPRNHADTARPATCLSTISEDTEE